MGLMKMDKVKLFRTIGFILFYYGLIKIFWGSLFNNIILSNVEIGIVIIFAGMFCIFQSMDYENERYTFQHRLHDSGIKTLRDKFELLEYSNQHLDDEITKIQEGR